MSDINNTEAPTSAASHLQAVGDAARQVGAQARQSGADAVDKARDVAQDAQQRATSVIQTIGQQASAAVETQKDSLADRLDDIAAAVHQSGEKLEGQQDWIASLVESGANELSALAGTLRSNDLQSLVGNLGGLARRQPALFAGAALVLGFALTRIGRVAVSGADGGGDQGMLPPAIAAHAQSGPNP